MRILNGVIVAAIIAGTMMYMQQSQENRNLQGEFDRLLGEVGIFHHSEPPTPRLITVSSDDKLLFRWRLYVPANLPPLIISKSGGMSQMGGGGSSETLITVKFDMRGDDLGCYSRCRQWSGEMTSETADLSSGVGGGRNLLAYGKTALFLKDHWEELVISVFDSDGRTPIDLSKPVELMNIAVPDHLHHSLSHTMDADGEDSMSMLYGVVHEDLADSRSLFKLVIRFATKPKLDISN